MKVQCPDCKANYKIDISKIAEIPEKGVHMTCPKCKGSILIKIKPEPKKEEQQDTIIICPKCSHVNISTKTCVSCGNIFTKEETEKLSIAIDKEE
ncbi:MAG: zinc-ribbon domain-containing protein [Deltaproteobacteria bacterium]|nr:zinc-ribbon domain-containing protein [Deltaproteobacteria bacterium]